MIHVSHKLSSMCERHLSLLFYDCTNFHFETPRDDASWNLRRARKLARRWLREGMGSAGARFSDEELNSYLDNDPDGRRIADALGFRQQMLMETDVEMRSHYSIKSLSLSEAQQSFLEAVSKGMQPQDGRI
jgi:hypothetical protein